MGQRVFITGATGVLGRRVVPRLVEAGHRVTALVRSEAKAAAVHAAGATPIEVDLFDGAAIRAAIGGHDSIAQLATHIPYGPAASQRSAWETNDRLRGVAAPAIAGAAVDAGVGRFIQESITFPYDDGGGDWIDEHHQRTYFWGNQCTATAEAAAASVTAAGGVGVVLRFALFMAPGSAHTQGLLDAASDGLFAIVGDLQGYVSFIHIDDAAAAVVAALDASAGVYNVAEPDPLRRAAHRDALSSVVGKPLVEREGADAANGLARSHRISSRLLSEATGWAPRVNCVEQWKELS
jgi:nucleoside-diphosphate-sugar epimerase